MKRLPTIAKALSLVALFLVFSACPDTGSLEVAAVLPLTGSEAIYGEALKRGIEIASEEIDAAGNMPFELTISMHDSGSDPTQGAAALKAAYNTAFAAIGGVTSAEALAMVAVADDAGKVLLSPTASSPELSGISPNFFRIFPSSQTESITLLQFLDKLGITKLAILLEDTPFGRGAAESLTGVFEGEIVATVKFPTGVTDYFGQTSEVLASQPEGIFVAATASNLANAIKNLRAAGYNEAKDWIVTTSAVATPSVIGELGDASERVFFSQSKFDVNGTEEPMASFVAAYEAKYGAKPDLYAAHGYDAVKVMAQAFVEGEVMLPDDTVTGLRSLANLPGVTGAIQFRENGDVQRFMRNYMIVSGELVDYDEWLKKQREEVTRRMEELSRQRERLLRDSQ